MFRITIKEIRDNGASEKPVNQYKFELKRLDLVALMRLLVDPPSTRKSRDPQVPAAPFKEGIS